MYVGADAIGAEVRSEGRSVLRRRPRTVRRSLLAALVVLPLMVTIQPSASAEGVPTESEKVRALSAARSGSGTSGAGGGYEASVLTGGTDPRGDAADPRGDIISLVADNATHDNDITVGIEVVQGDSYFSDPWVLGVTGIVWGVDINGDRNDDWFVTVTSSRSTGPRYTVRRVGTTTPTCQGTPVSTGNLYGVVFSSTCIGSPASISVSAFMSYDFAFNCSTCAPSEDLTGYTPAAARGQASGPAPSPAPAPAPAPAPGGTGYWFVAGDGGIFTYNAPFHGSAAGQTSSPVVGMAAHPNGSGYWIVEANGRVHARGVAHHGDLAGKPLNSPIVGMAATPAGGGYYLLGRDGGIFTFGDAPFHGSTGNLRLNQPVIGMAARKG